MFSAFSKSKKLLANQFFVEHPAPSEFKPVKENYISLKQGTIVYSPGDLADAVYLLVKGTVIKRIPQSGFDLAEEVSITEDSYFGKEEVADSGDRRSLVICDTNCTVYKLLKSDLIEQFPSVFYSGALIPETEVISSGSTSFEEELALAEADYESFLKEEQIQTNAYITPEFEEKKEVTQHAELDDLLSFSSPMFFEPEQESAFTGQPQIAETDVPTEPSFDDFIKASFEQPLASVPELEESSIPPWEAENHSDVNTFTESESKETHPFNDFYIPTNNENNADSEKQEFLLVSGLFYQDLQQHLTDILRRASSLQLRHPLKEEYDELEKIIQDSGNMLSMLELFYFQDAISENGNFKSDFATIFASIERPLQRYALKFDVRLYKKINESGIVSLNSSQALKLFLLSLQILINQHIRYKQIYFSSEHRFDDLKVTIGLHSENESHSNNLGHTAERIAPALKGLIKMLDEICNALQVEHALRINHDTISSIHLTFKLNT